MIAKKYEGEAWYYDYISFYPSIMRSDKMLFPIKQGEFKLLTQTEFEKLKFLQFGIFRAKIIKSTDKNINKLIRFNINNYYTHIDLNLAKKYNLQIKIKRDGNPNFLYYKRENLVSGKVLFRDYIDYFFKLKQEKVLGAKNLLNYLWGSLCEKNVIRIKFNIADELELFDNNKIIDIIPDSFDSSLLTAYITKNKYFNYDLARIKPFLLAKGRFILSNTIYSFRDKIIYSHTDSLIVKEKINIKTGNNIGDLKYEGYCEKFWCENITKKTKKSNFII